MKIEFRLLQKLQSRIGGDAHPMRLSEYSRPILNERDYRESKALLSAAARSASDPESALRAEALLREIVDYEMRFGITESEGLAALETPDDVPGHENPMRRWSDRTDG